MSVAFTKMHGAGNDFILLDGRSGLTPNPGEFASEIANRRFGVGCDQVLVIREGTSEQFAMEIWNADGSRAEMCGNGIRCFAKWLYDHDEITSRRAVIETLGGKRWVDVAGYHDGCFEVSVGMGYPSFDPDALPMVPGLDQPNVTHMEINDHCLDVVGVSVGNPHAIAFMNDIDHFPLDVVGPAVERHSSFPQRVNFEIAQVTGPAALKLRVWERGAGLTLACGTGAAATAAAAIVEGYVSSGDVELEMPGGRLSVTWQGDGSEVVLRGPAVTVFSGTWTSP